MSLHFIALNDKHKQMQTMLPTTGYRPLSLNPTSYYIVGLGDKKNWEST